MSTAPLLEMRGISKRFPGVVALDNVSLAVGKGEVVAVCGENGAGKSTLMKILGGVYTPDGGEILVDGRPVKINNVNDAMKLGIAFIHQELNVLDNLDVAANVFLGREPLLQPFRLINSKKIHADTEPYLKRLGLNISSRTRLDKLSIAQQQMVEIAKALSLNARIIIMDEPTSSLTLTETERLLELVCELSEQGVSVVYISHRLAEVNNCADRVVVLRDGKNAGILEQSEISHDHIVNLMVGREIKSFYVQSEAQKTPGFFKVRNMRTGRYPAQEVSFDAAKGEILGFAGLVGAGRSEIAKAIVGLDRSATGEVNLGGETIPAGNSREAINRGIYLVPEDRRGEGLITGMNVRENTTLPSLKRFAPFNLIRRDREKKVANEQIQSLKIKTPGTETFVLNLSGGNQQKVVLGKWLSMNPKVMILDEPTRGIDVGAKAEIYRLMRALADNGAVILMISSDMEEILNMSDRVAVMHEGQITGVLERTYCNEENIMQLATGKLLEEIVLKKQTDKVFIRENKKPANLETSQPIFSVSKSDAANPTTLEFDNNANNHPFSKVCLVALILNGVLTIFMLLLFVPVMKLLLANAYLQYNGFVIGDWRNLWVFVFLSLSIFSLFALWKTFRSNEKWAVKAVGSLVALAIFHFIDALRFNPRWTSIDAIEAIVQFLFATTLAVLLSRHFRASKGTEKK